MWPELMDPDSQQGSVLTWCSCVAPNPRIEPVLSSEDVNALQHIKQQKDILWTFWKRQYISPVFIILRGMRHCIYVSQEAVTALLNSHPETQKKCIETICNKQVIRADRWLLTTYFSWGVGFNESHNINQYSRTWKICCKVLSFFCLGSPKIKQGKRVCVALGCLGPRITHTEIFLCLQHYRKSVSERHDRHAKADRFHRKQS